MELLFEQELSKPGVAQAARCFFDGLGGLAGSGIRAGLGFGVCACVMKRQAELRGEIADKGEIGVGFCSAESVMQVRYLQHEAEFQSKAVGHAQTAADVALNQFNAGTVSYTTVITDIQMLIADQESLLTIQQNQLVADVSLIEALGGGWDDSQIR